MFRPLVAALELDFAAEAEAELSDVRAQLAASGHGSPPGLGPPHVSLAAGLGIASQAEVDRCEAAVRMSQEAAPRTVMFQDVSSFPGEEQVVYLAPAPAKELIGWHRHLWPYAERALAAPIHYYAPANWVPHCTMRSGAGRPVDETVGWLRDRLKLPMRVTVGGVTLRLYESGHMTELWRVDLTHRA